jgi:hypothetical protein
MAAHTMLDSTTHLLLAQATTHHIYNHPAQWETDIDLAWVATVLLMAQTPLVKEDKAATPGKDLETVRQRKTTAINSTSKRRVTTKGQNLTTRRRFQPGAS